MSGEKSNTVFVMGMHRSGTSLVTRILSELGAYCGQPESHLEPNQWNSSGYFELKELVAINNLLLNDQGCDWANALGFRADAVTAARKQHATKRLSFLTKSLHKARSRKQPFIALKDPRLCLTSPALGIDTAMVLFVSRHPLSVAASLDVRDNLGMTVAMALWELYTLHFLGHGMANAALLVSYERLLSDPIGETERMTMHLRSLGIVESVDDQSLARAAALVQTSGNEAKAIKRFADFMLPAHQSLWDRLSSGGVENLDRQALSGHSADILEQFRKLANQRKMGHPAYVSKQEGEKTREYLETRLESLEAKLNRLEQAFRERG
ncbi:MAG: hypothetical protein DHS20C11_17140 [Lysobacteraceae bacterium]|nr:MAG: hypothetical protein DHS20C11_17140 [Xanthomonadaceae bacterium]